MVYTRCSERNTSCIDVRNPLGVPRWKSTSMSAAPVSTSRQSPTAQPTLPIHPRSCSGFEIVRVDVGRFPTVERHGQRRATGISPVIGPIRDIAPERRPADRPHESRSAQSVRGGGKQRKGRTPSHSGRAGSDERLARYPSGLTSRLITTMGSKPCSKNVPSLTGGACTHNACRCTRVFVRATRYSLTNNRPLPYKCLAF